MHTCMLEGLSRFNALTIIHAAGIFVMINNELTLKQQLRPFSVNLHQGYREQCDQHMPEACICSKQVDKESALQKVQCINTPVGRIN